MQRAFLPLGMQFSLRCHSPAIAGTSSGAVPGQGKGPVMLPVVQQMNLKNVNLKSKELPFPSSC